jgi:hypothetical protein
MKKLANQENQYQGPMDPQSIGHARHSSLSEMAVKALFNFMVAFVDESEG